MFKDAFSSGFQQAQSSLAGMKGALGEINKNQEMNRLAADMSMMVAMTDPLRQSLSSALESPARAASALENPMAAVNSVLNEMNAIGGDVGATYEAMEAAALKWATGTAPGSKLATASAGKFAEVSYSMLSAGLNAEQGIMATQQALILAKATMGDASEAAGLLATVYNNMGDKSADVGVEMTRLSDVLAKTQAYFQIANLGQLNEGLKYAIPVAQQFGMSISEVTSVVGQLNTAGLQGSMAGTALGSMMSKVHDAAKKLDFSIAYDASGGVKLIDTLKNIQAQYGPINTWNTDTKLAFQEAFGQEGVRAVTLLQTSLGSLSTAYGEIANASGVAADMAGKMSDTYEDKMARLANASEAMQAQIGTDINQIKGFFVDMKVGFLQNVAAPIMGSPVGPAISKMTALFGMAAKTALDMGSGALNTAAQLSVLTANIQNAGGIAKLFTSSIGFMRSGFGMLLTPLKVAGSGLAAFSASVKSVGFMQTFQGGLSAIGGGISSMGKGIVGILPKMGAWIASAWAAAAAHVAAFWPVYAVIGVIAALAGIVVLLVKNWDSVSAFFVRLWDGVKNTFFSAMEWIRGVIFGASDWILAAVALFLPFIGIPALVIKHWDGIKTFFVELWGNVKTSFTNFLSWIGGAVEAFIAPFKKIAGGISDFFGKLFGEAKDSGAKLTDTFAQGIQGNAGAPSAAFGSSLQGIGSQMPHSDADEGPLSRLSESGRALTDTFAAGMDPATLEQRATLAFQAAAPGGEISLGAANAEAAGAATGPQTFHIENLYLQADDCRTLLDFLRQIQHAVYRPKEVPV